jgi:hypothetical protein
MAGATEAGNVPMSGIPPGPANVGGLNNINVDPVELKMRPSARAVAAAHRRPQIPQAK